VELFHGTIKNECIRRKALLGQVRAKAVIDSYIDFYNNQRLHSTNGYIAPLNQFIGRATEIHQERRKKLNQVKLESKQKYLKNESRILTNKCVNSHLSNCTLTNYKRHPVFSDFY